MSNEISYIKSIDDEDEDKDDIEYSLPVIDMLTSIHLCNKRGIECLQLPWLPYNVARLLIVPIMPE